MSGQRAATPIHVGAEFIVTPASSRVRLGVLAFLCSLMFVLYLDRVCISQAAAAIQAELGLTNSQLGLVFVSFTLAYGLFEIPAGRWGDRYGSRRVLTRIAVWWSAFTVLTAFCFGFYSLVTVRFLFGAGEAGAFPNAARIIARWFSAGERGRVQGLVMAYPSHADSVAVGSFVAVLSRMLPQVDQRMKNASRFSSTEVLVNSIPTLWRLHRGSSHLTLSS